MQPILQQFDVLLYDMTSTCHLLTIKPLIPAVAILGFRKMDANTSDRATLRCLAEAVKRETVPWAKVLQLLVVNRLIDPGSEFRVTS